MIADPMLFLILLACSGVPDAPQSTPTPILEAECAPGETRRLWPSGAVWSVSVTTPDGTIVAPWLQFEMGGAVSVRCPDSGGTIMVDSE
ncbi:MAG: hypothetical protein EB145_08925 [Proteobacteria bacterium]|nr:hypothetical protein [Pseudomonadota bacterium]